MAKGQTRSFEYATWLLVMKKKNITVTGIYHPALKNTITNSMFINDITDYLISLLPTATNNIILGDFNMHINDSNSNDAWIFKDTFTTLGLTQHVTTSKHVKGNILDLIFMEEISSIKLTSCQAGSFLSDHKLVTAVVNINKQPIEKKILSVHKLHCITEDSFKSAFNESAIDLTSPVETVLYQLNNELHKALDTIAPLKQIQVPACQKQPWFNEIVKARHKVVWNTSTLCPIPGRPIRLKEMCTTDSSSIRRDGLSPNRLSTRRALTKSSTKLMAQLVGIRTDNPLPLHNSDESLAHHFADYFILKNWQNMRKLLQNSNLCSRNSRYPNLPKVCSPYCRSGH